MHFLPRLSDSVPLKHGFHSFRAQTHVLKTPPCPHRIFDLKDSLDKLMHFLPQLSDFVPLRNGFYSFRAQTDYHHPVDPDSNTVVARGVADLYSLMKRHNPLYERSEYHTQLAKMNFDKIFDLTAGVYFNFYNTCTRGVRGTYMVQALYG